MTESTKKRLEAWGQVLKSEASMAEEFQEYEITTVNKAEEAPMLSSQWHLWAEANVSLLKPSSEALSLWNIPNRLPARKHFHFILKRSFG